MFVKLCTAIYLPIKLFIRTNFQQCWLPKEYNDKEHENLNIFNTLATQACPTVVANVSSQNFQNKPLYVKITNK